MARQFAGFAELGEGGMVGEIEAERCEGDEAMLDGPSIGPLDAGLKRPHCEPEVLATLGIRARDDFAVVALDRLSGPADALRPRRQVDVHEREAVLRQEQLQHLLDMRGEDIEVGPLGFGRRAQRDPRDTQQECLLCSRQRA
jgi:hypothetical protein